MRVGDYPARSGVSLVIYRCAGCPSCGVGVPGVPPYFLVSSIRSIVAFTSSLSRDVQQESTSRQGSVIQGQKLGKRLAFLFLFAVLLAGAVAASLLFGSNNLPPDQVLAVFNGTASEQAQTIVMEQRIPRTLVGLAAGAALAVAGSLMQSLTRNPLAEPGLMGVNAGAAVAVIASVVVFGVMGIWQYMVAATIGGALAAVLVYTLGRGRDGSIVKLALAGVAISAALSAIAQGLILADQDAYNEFRVWVAGSLEGRGMDIASTVGPVIVLGMLVAFFVAPAINALSMGEEAATSLGVSVRTTQNLTLLAVTVLAGAATAAVGPIGFVGLAVPFVVRALLGNDVRWVNYGSALLGPVWLLCADVLARVLVAPQETQVGIVATLAGAPVFLFLMTRRKVEAL